MGVDVFLSGFIGKDHHNHIFKSLLAKSGVKDLVIESEVRKTTTKSRVIANNHQLIRIDSEIKTPISKLEENLLLEKLSLILESCGCILLSDYNKGVITQSLVEEIVKLASRNKIKILVDPKTPPFSKYKGVNIIKPNKKEASIATGIEINNGASLESACKSIVEQTGCETVVITLSEQGVAYYQNNLIVIIPTRAQEIFDVTGAGDTFLAGLAHSILNGYNIHDACEFANYASAIVVAKYGCATVSLNDIKLFKESFN
jgi:D-beta-D-heptose 7-phosphate kinase/D-beta-D-heptose 1-phosphate adenosyltransferase